MQAEDGAVALRERRPGDAPDVACQVAQLEQRFHAVAAFQKDGVVALVEDEPIKATRRRLDKRVTEHG
eukprot:1883873-Prymnesium_polylepis.1